VLGIGRFPTSMEKGKNKEIQYSKKMFRIGILNSRSIKWLCTQRVILHFK